MKKLLKFLLAVVAVAVVAVGAYVGYVALQYYRVGDVPLEVENNQQGALRTGQAYTAMTYNIGFGAYDHAFSFFMDTGVMLGGTAVAGTGSKAASLEVAQKNTQGAGRVAEDKGCDFYLFQEVDQKSHRARGVDQRASLNGRFSAHGSVYCLNFHSAFLAYPLNDFHGQTEAGLLTLSRYGVTKADRVSYPVDESFPTRFFDLDRCFSVSRLEVEGGRQLVLINSHMSAYDQGGLVRKAQLETLMSFIAREYAAGNYVIVGGDFNHDIASSLNAFATEQFVPEWVYTLEEADVAQGFSIVKAENATLVPTVRSTDMAYVKGVNYTAVVDGFIVSDNVSAMAVNVDTDFEFSDHNPAVLTFTLRG